jgi:hypothetical protein
MLEPKGILEKGFLFPFNFPAIFKTIIIHALQNMTKNKKINACYDKLEPQP